MPGAVSRALRGGRIRLACAVCALAALATAMTLAPAMTASAHDYLVKTSPAANSVQTTPISAVKLTYDDIVLDLSGNGSSSLVQITGPNGASTHFETGCPKVLGRSVSTPVALGAGGKYEVSWQVVSADGHVVSGTFDFSYQPPAGTKAARGSATRPTCAPKAGSEQPAATSAAAVSQGSSDAGLVIGIAVAIVVLAIIGVIIVLLTARAKTTAKERWHPGDS